MKTRAGLKLYGTKPRQAPARDRGRKAIVLWRRLRQTMNRITAAIAPTPTARPSIVSNQFIAFISSTSQATVAGTATQVGRSKTPPNGGGAKGLEMLLMGTPKAT